MPLKKFLFVLAPTEFHTHRPPSIGSTAYRATSIGVHSEVHSIHRYVLPLRIASSAYRIAENGLDETGLTSLSIEALHSCLIQIHQYVLNDPSLVKIDQFEQLLALLQKGDCR